MLKLACPPDNGLVPRTVVPSRKLTSPIGVPPLPVTVAVKVTDSPEPDGFLLELRAMEEAGLITLK